MTRVRIALESDDRTKIEEIVFGFEFPDGAIRAFAHAVVAADEIREELANA